METTTLQTRKLHKQKIILKVLMVCGILSSLLYAAMNIFVPMMDSSYSSVTQTISELSAIDAPTRPLWVPLGFLYTLLFAVFGWGVWKSAAKNRPLRIAGGLMLMYGVISLAWPFAPMHQREVLAAGGGTLTDTLHLGMGGVSALFMIAAMGFGAGGIRKALPVVFHYNNPGYACVWRLNQLRCS